MALRFPIWMGKPYSKKLSSSFQKLYKKHWQKTTSNRPILICSYRIKPTYGLLNLCRKHWDWVIIKFLTIFKNTAIRRLPLFLLLYAKHGKKEKLKRAILFA